MLDGLPFLGWAEPLRRGRIGVAVSAAEGRRRRRWSLPGAGRDRAFCFFFLRERAGEAGGGEGAGPHVGAKKNAR